ncbi:MAG TPA: hypothetical protein VG124_03220 [Beijerinckiaceae bacterium]|jgi:hypothetical protein|nr:hypothetical protein [Beijerinckiaceae bacterium]
MGAGLAGRGYTLAPRHRLDPKELAIFSMFGYQSREFRETENH